MFLLFFLVLLFGASWGDLRDGDLDCHRTMPGGCCTARCRRACSQRASDKYPTSVHLHKHGAVSLTSKARTIGAPAPGPAAFTAAATTPAKADSTTDPWCRPKCAFSTLATRPLSQDIFASQTFRLAQRLLGSLLLLRSPLLLHSS